MDTGSTGESNTLNLITKITSCRGDTFKAKAQNYLKVIDTRMTRLGQGSDEWQQLLKTKGLVEGFIRFDGDIPLALEVSESAIKIAA